MENLKTLILTNNENKNFKAILNLKNREGTLKFFTPNNINSNLALGIKQGTEVLKIPLNIISNNCVFSLPQEIKYNTNLMCAVVDVSNAFCPQIILSGSLNNSSENVKIESAFIKTKPEDVSTLYEQETDAEIENIVESNIEDDAKSIYYDTCASCKYRKAFYEEGCACSKHNNPSYENINKTKNIEENIIKINAVNNKQAEDKNHFEENNFNKNIEEIVEPQTFYSQVKPQVDALFEKYQPDDILNGIIGNSKWVRVKYDGGEEFYVLGLIFNDKDINQVDFICYGVPSISPNNPPEDIKDYAQWLPSNIQNPQGEGYFIVYQNAYNGETVTVDFV